MTTITYAADTVPRLDAPIIQAESAIANQRLVERANAPMMTTTYSPNKSTTLIVKDEVSFQIDHIEVHSEDSHFKYLCRALSSDEGKSIGQHGIEQLTKELQERILSDGYVTSHVTVPNQDLSTRKLIFEVIPGYVEDIKFKDPSARGNWRAAFPVRPKDILRRQALEQGVDQMRSVVGQDVKVSLEPGTKENTSIVVLDVIQNGYVHGGFSVDDAGYEVTGKVQGTAFISISQLAGLEEVL